MANVFSGWWKTETDQPQLNGKRTSRKNKSGAQH
jgi:hypothetical protein